MNTALPIDRQPALPEGLKPSHLKLVPHDLSLVNQALSADLGLRHAAQDELYRRYRQAVRRLASSFGDLDEDEVEDVVQDSFVRAFRALPGLKERERFSSWLFTITRNRARSTLSARSTLRRAAEQAQRDADTLSDAAPAASEQLERELGLQAVREVIEQLKEGAEKETVRLFYLEGTLSAREIADRMGVGKSAITMRLERFRAKVKSAIVAKCG